MAGPKILNLDTLETGTEKAITIGGKTYEMKPFTVKDFIDQVRIVEQTKASDSVEAFNVVVDSIVRAFPGLDRETLEALDVAKLNAIFEFIQGSAEEEVAAGNGSSASE